MNKAIIRRYPFLHGFGSLLDIGGTNGVDPYSLQTNIPGFEADFQAFQKDQRTTLHWLREAQGQNAGSNR